MGYIHRRDIRIEENEKCLLSGKHNLKSVYTQLKQLIDNIALYSPLISSSQQASGNAKYECS